MITMENGLCPCAADSARARASFSLRSADHIRRGSHGSCFAKMSEQAVKGAEELPP
jgi:hypothetical protein